MKKVFYISVILPFVLLQACSTYNSTLKGDDFDKKFEMANELFDTKQYDRSISLYEQVYQRAPKTAQGEIAYYRIGKAYYTVGNYYLAGYYLKSFSEKFPSSIKAEETTFLNALCSVQNSPNYTLDQTDTEIALNELQIFINNYPESRLIDSCNMIMDKLRFKLEKKDFEAVRLYSKMENYRAASSAAETFLTEYPGSSFREEAYFIMVRNSYFLAINSIENKKKDRFEKTIERYLNFVAEFPGTSYKKDIDSFFERSKKEVEKL